MQEAAGMLGHVGGAEVLESGKAANLHMQKKGGLGVVTILMRAHDVVDAVKIVLPSPADARLAQQAGDWGELWAAKLRLAVM